MHHQQEARFRCIGHSPEYIVKLSVHVVLIGGRNTCHASIKPVPGSLHRLGMAAPVRIPVARLTLSEGCPKCLKLLPQNADNSSSARWP